MIPKSWEPVFEKDHAPSKLDTLMLDGSGILVALAFARSWAALAISACTDAGELLDDRAARIKAELDEARKLKDEAAALLAEYQRKRQQAESEAQAILAGAQGRGRAAGYRSQEQDRGIRGAAHQDRRNQDRPAEAQATARCANCGRPMPPSPPPEKILSREAKASRRRAVAKGIEDVRKKLN